MKVNRSRYTGMTLRQLYLETQTAKPGKDARELHRELKKHGDRLFLLDRYPELQITMLCVAAIISIAVIVALIII